MKDKLIKIAGELIKIAENLMKIAKPYEDFDYKKWELEGFTEEEALKWYEVGFKDPDAPSVAKICKELGFSPEEGAEVVGLLGGFFGIEFYTDWERFLKRYGLTEEEILKHLKEALLCLSKIENRKKAVWGAYLYATKEDVVGKGFFDAKLRFLKWYVEYEGLLRRLSYHEIPEWYRVFGNISPKVWLKWYRQGLEPEEAYELYEEENEI